MASKEKIQKIKDQISTAFKENKLLLIVGTSVCIVAMLLMINLHVLQMTVYMLQNDTNKVIEVLEKDIAKTSRTDDWYFKQGISYLLKDMSEESHAFLESQYKHLDAKIQENIIQAYNEQQLLFKQNQDIFDVIATEEVSEVYRQYVKRMDIGLIEKTLQLYMGEDIKVTQNTVNQLYKILSMQTAKIGLDQFKISIYELMSFPQSEGEESIALKLLDSIKPEAVREMLFNELKTKPIELEAFSDWVDILNKKKVISTSEYAQFSSNYGSIKRMQDQYKQVLLQEVDLINVKQKIDVQTEEVSNKVVKLEKEIDDIRKEIATENQRLDKLKQYRKIDLYVLDQYDNGDYEVSIPEKSWLFNTYKPTDVRIRLKVNTSTITSLGVMSFDVYDRGKSAEGLPYYVEVTQDEYNQMAEIENSITKKNASITQKKQEIETLNQEIAQIRKINNYEQTLLLIEEVVAKKENLKIEMKKAKIEIQNLFHIGELVVQEKD